MIKNIDSYLRNGRNNLKHLLNDELRNHYSKIEIENINSKLKRIEIEYKPILLNSKSRSEFLTVFSGIKKYQISETKTADQKIWNQLIEELMIKLFYIFPKMYQLTPNEAFIYYVFQSMKRYFNHKIEHDYLYKYITQNGKVGLNILGIYACDYIKRQIKNKEAIDLKIFLFYFKNHYKPSNLIIENIDQFVSITKKNLKKFLIRKSQSLISHYLKEFRDDEYFAPKLDSYEYNKHFYYLFLRGRLKDCFRESENQLREKLGYKRIGEGNVQEHTLYKELCKYIDKKHIKRNYRPIWLNGLELDFYIEPHRLGIEYQGQQHVKPVDYFGGKKSFKKQIKRDLKKVNLCHSNDIKIVHCYFDQSIPEFAFKIFSNL
ncbi:hypothetical protein ND860_18695 [Leptospira levettii]|uniref:hypothetical protein n=1 Tax=Leptospira levettii TaxID=2023178 RepID=UPI00223E8A4C|nr:hypothetical protein [Leptospira levettii]MCW7498571.1 hypothetical protein [Leptospira levettii]